MKVKKSDVAEAFRLLVEELDRHDADTTGWTLLDNGYPEGWRIIVRRWDGTEAYLALPGMGLLGDTSERAFDKLWKWREGMVVARMFGDRSESI